MAKLDIEEKFKKDISKEVANLKEFLISQGKEIVKLKQENKVRKSMIILFLPQDFFLGPERRKPGEIRWQCSSRYNLHAGEASQGVSKTEGEHNQAQ